MKTLVLAFAALGMTLFPAASTSAPRDVAPSASSQVSISVLPGHEFNLRLFVTHLHAFQDPRMDELATWMLLTQEAAKKGMHAEYSAALSESTAAFSKLDAQHQESLQLFIDNLPTHGNPEFLSFGCCSVTCAFGSCRACGFGRTCSCVLGNPVCGTGGAGGWAGVLRAIFIIV